MSLDLSLFDQYYQVPKAWGKEYWLTNVKYDGKDTGYCAKILVLNDGWQCSLHRHIQKDETFFVLEGQVELHIVGGKDGMYRQHIVLDPGNNYHISPGVYHRFNTAKPGGAVILEVSTPHSDLDVERLEVSAPYICT